MRSLAGLALLACAIPIFIVAPPALSAPAALQSAEDILGCWDLPFRQYGWPYITMCFEHAGSMTIMMCGVEECLGEEGQYEVLGDKLQFQTEWPGDAWLFEEADLDCTVSLHAETGLDLADCGSNRGHFTFDRVPSDPMFRWFADRMDGDVAELSAAFIGCWFHYGSQSVDITTLCFADEGQLVARTTRGSEKAWLEGDEDALRRVQLSATYAVSDGHLRIDGPGGEGWAFEHATMDCDVVMVPNSRFRLGHCADGSMTEIFERDE